VSQRATPPAIGEGKRGLEGHLLYLLRQANAAVLQTVDGALAELELSLPQYSALTMISAYSGITGAELARLSMLTPQSTHEVIRRLLARGLIARRADPGDKRLQLLTITQTGRELVKRGRTITDPIEARLASLTGADRAKSWLVDVAVQLNADVSE
jgi:DNA-binding MarR family transcriptional regulator